MKNSFYLKIKKEIVPTTDKKLNDRALERLNEIFENPQKYNIPHWIVEKRNKVALYNAKGDVEKAKSLYLTDEKSSYDLSNKLNDLLAKEWLPETITVFSQRGLGAGSEHAKIEKQHPAPYSYQDVSRFIRFFTKEGDVVLDPFVGVGSTLKACAIENRKGVGIELNAKYAQLSKERVETEVEDSFQYKQMQTVINDDASVAIDSFENDYFDFIVTSPPYWNILETVDHKARERQGSNLDTKYSNSKSDFGNIEDYNVFLSRLVSLFESSSRILKHGKYMAIVVSDFRKKDDYYIFHADLARELEKTSSFKLKGIKILYQRHKSIYPYGYPFTFVPNVHHQNVLIFQNTKNS